MYTRNILPLLNEALADTPVVLLNGARQTGKSTLVQSLSAGQDAQVLRVGTPGILPPATLAHPCTSHGRTGAAAAHTRRYLTLDDRVTLTAAKGDPEGFVAGLNESVTLDEVQRAPELFLAIKASVDRDRRPGRFLLTGSANVLLLPAIINHGADSLAGRSENCSCISNTSAIHGGRMEVLSLWPLSSAEIAEAPTINLADWLFNGPMNALTIPPCDRTQLVEKLLSGGFPEAVSRSSPRRRAAWFDSYLQAIMQRDVRDLANVEPLTAIPDLIQLLATRSATLLNFAEISRSSGLPQTTLKRYFSLLETLFLVYRLPSWERNPGKRLVKAPKIFLPDSGLLAHLVELSQERLSGLMGEAGLPGRLVETFVLSELLKHLAFSEKHLTLWHYRTQSNIEVDFVLENRLGKLTGIEARPTVMWTAKTSKAYAT